MAQSYNGNRAITGEYIFRAIHFAAVVYARGCFPYTRVRMAKLFERHRHFHLYACIFCANTHAYTHRHFHTTSSPLWANYVIVVGLANLFLVRVVRLGTIACNMHARIYLFNARAEAAHGIPSRARLQWPRNARTLLCLTKSANPVPARTTANSRTMTLKMCMSRGPDEMARPQQTQMKSTKIDIANCESIRRSIHKVHNQFYSYIGPNPIFRSTASTNERVKKASEKWPTRLEWKCDDYSKRFREWPTVFVVKQQQRPAIGWTHKNVTRKSVMCDFSIQFDALFVSFLFFFTLTLQSWEKIAQHLPFRFETFDANDGDDVSGDGKRRDCVTFSVCTRLEWMVRYNGTNVCLYMFTGYVFLYSNIASHAAPT